MKGKVTIEINQLNIKQLKMKKFQEEQTNKLWKKDADTKAKQADLLWPTFVQKMQVRNR